MLESRLDYETFLVPLTRMKEAETVELKPLSFKNEFQKESKDKILSKQQQKVQKCESIAS